MSKNAIIKSLTLDIGGTKIELTPEQARQLYGALGELFAVKERVVTIPAPDYSPVRKPRVLPDMPWEQPTAQWRWPGRRYDIFCESGVKAHFNPKRGELTMSVAA